MPDQPSAAEVLVRASGLARRFGDFWAVRGVDLHVASGEIVGLLGPNGAGKSTTIRMLCGLLPPTSGEITVAGVDPVRHPQAVKSRIGYMTQHFSLYADLTVRENLDFYAAMYGLRPAERRRAVDDWLERLDLARASDQPAGLLPPGFQRRAAFACAVVAQPPVLMLDEPTSGADLQTSDLLWRLIAEQAAAGAAVLVTTHWMAEAERCHRVCIMASGRLVADGPPDRLTSALQGRVLGIKAQPLHLAAQALRGWQLAAAVSIAGEWIRVETRQPAEHLAEQAARVVAAAGAQVLDARPLNANLDDVFVHFVAGAETG